MVLASVKAAKAWAGPRPCPCSRTPPSSSSASSRSAILYWIFATKVVPKMEAMYEERAAAIEGGMQQAEEAQAEAKAALEKYNAQLAGARTEANEIRESAREQGASIVAEMRGQAQAEAARITESAKRQVEAERQQAVVQLRQEVGTLSTVPREQDRRGVPRGRGAPEGHRRPLPRRARGRRGHAREGRPRGSGRLMRGSSRGSAKAVQAAFDTALAGGSAWETLAEELFAVTAVVDGNASLRRALADPSPRRRPTSRAWPVRSSAARSVRPPPASSPRSPASAGRPSATSADTLESLAVQALLAAAERERPHRPRRGRAVPLRADRRRRPRPARHPVQPQHRRLRQGRRSCTGCSRARPRPETVRLAEQAVRVPRGRRLDRVMEAYLRLAASVVTSSPPSSPSPRRSPSSSTPGCAARSRRTTASRSRLQVVLDPAVMGGIRVQVGDEVVDGTVLRRLDEARRHVTGG